LAVIWKAPGSLRERIVSLPGSSPTEYPVLAIKLSFD
jgi:hypothetical protein